MSRRSKASADFRPTELQDEFFDHSEDQIAAAQALLDGLHKGGGQGASALGEFRRIAHSLKGRGTMFEIPSVSAVAAKLEDFMAGLVGLSAADVTGIRRYFDQLDAIVEARRDLVEPELSERLGKLPSPRRAGSKD